MKRSGTLLNTILILGIVINVCVALAVSSLDTWAGDINSDEARVIAVASGTFTYDGKTYKAYSDYISSLYSYLASDDVDLTAAQADKAINYIYSNVSSGIASGYIYEIDKSEDDSIDLDSDWEPDLSGYDTHLPTDDEEESDAARDVSQREVEEMFGDLEEDYSNRTISRPSASETDAVVIMTEDEIVITTDDSEIAISKSDRIIPQYVINILIIVGLAVLIIDILIAVILTAKGCMRFRVRDRSRLRRGHSTRRRIRKACRRILTVTSVVSIIGIFMIIAVSIGLYNQNKIIQNIQDSGYFRYAYTKYISDNSENMDDVMSYEDYLVEEKKALDHMQSSEYSEDISIAPYISEMQDDMRQGLIISAICLLVGLLIAGASNIFMDMRRDRGIRSIAISEIIGTVVTTTLAIVLRLIHMNQKLIIEPVYLGSFINSHIDWIIKILIVIGFFGAVVGMSLVGLYKSKVKDKG